MEKCRACVADLLGACHEDFCRTEREALAEEAERRATQHGHTLGEFVKSKGCPVWQAQCIHCGKSAVICIDPMPGEADIDGEAVSARCPAGRDSLKEARTTATD